MVLTVCGTGINLSSSPCCSHSMSMASWTSSELYSKPVLRCRSSHTFVAHLVLLVLPFFLHQGFVAESHQFLAQYAVDFRARHGDDIQELRTIMNADALNKNHSSANEVCHVNPTPARPPLWRRVHSTHWVWLVLCVVHSMPVAC